MSSAKCFDKELHQYIYEQAAPSHYFSCRQYQVYSVSSDETCFYKYPFAQHFIDT